MSDFGYGQIGPDDGATDLNTVAAVVRQLVARIDSMKLVKVVGVHAGSGSPPAVGTVDVLPLVSQIDANGYVVPHGTVYGLQYWRFQFGQWAIIADPAVNDVGYVVCADRDSSAVAKNLGQTVAPGSRRRYNIADGLYVGGCLNPVPAATLQLKPDGTWVLTDKPGNVLQGDANGITATPTSGKPFKVSGNLQVTGTIASGEGGGDQVSLQTHTHSGVQTGGGTSGPPTPGS
jgi:hypothetical protein